MYWIFLALFIFAVLTPDIIQRHIYFLTEERVEEILIFLMGALAFFVFIKNERKIKIQEKEKEKDARKINQTVKDLVESYSYIGEVNRKMDILMNIALGLSNSSELNKKKEQEIYRSIVSAANFLMKADKTCLRFIDVESRKTKKEFKITEDEQKEDIPPIGNQDLCQMEKNVNIRKTKGCMIVSSPRKINSIRSFLIICGFDPEEEKSPKNTEILKVFSSQALFLYSYLHKND